MAIRGRYPAGYEVQTVRIATRCLEDESCDAAGTAAELERLAAGLGIGFLNAGATSSLQRLAGGSIGRLIHATKFTSCSFAWQQVGLLLVHGAPAWPPPTLSPTKLLLNDQLWLF